MVGEGWPADLQWTLGVSFALAGNVLIAFSLVLQKHVHQLREEEIKQTWAGSANFLFALAMCGLILGEVGNFAAFGLASPTVVSPLGAVSVLTNALLSTIFLGETFLFRNLVGLFLVVVGSVIIVRAAPPTEGALSVEALSEALARPVAHWYLLLVTVASAALMCMEPAGRPSWGQRFLLVNVLLCSLLGSITVLCSSALSSVIGQVLIGDLSLLKQPLLWALLPPLIGCAIGQLRHLDRAMHYHHSSRVVPTYYVAFTICSITGSGVVLRDFERFTPVAALAFTSGIILSFLGVYLLVSRRLELARVPSPIPRSPVAKPSNANSSMPSPTRTPSHTLQTAPAPTPALLPEALPASLPPPPPIPPPGSRALEPSFAPQVLAPPPASTTLPKATMAPSPCHGSVGQPPAPSAVLAAVLAAAAAQAAAQPVAAPPTRAAEAETAETGYVLDPLVCEPPHAPSLPAAASGLPPDEPPQTDEPPRVTHHRRAFSDGAAMWQLRAQQQTEAQEQQQQAHIGAGLLVRISDLMERPVHVRAACSASASSRPSWSLPPHAGQADVISTSEISATDQDDEGAMRGRRHHLLTGVLAGGLLPRRTRRRYYSEYSHASSAQFAGPHGAPRMGQREPATSSEASEMTPHHAASAARDGEASGLGATACVDAVHSACVFRSPLSTSARSRAPASHAASLSRTASDLL